MTNALTNNASSGPNNSSGLAIAKQRFLKSQLAAFFEGIKVNGLDPADFVWNTLPALGGWLQPSLQLLHEPSGFYSVFHFHVDNQTQVIEYTPGAARRFEKPGGVSWDNMLGHFHQWLTSLKREVEAPDVWDMVQQEREALASSPSPDSDNSPFTSAEMQKVVAGLEEIEQYLLTAHRLDPELVEARIKYLEGAAERVGRTDWKGLLQATIFGLLVEAAVPAETFRDVFRFVGGIIIEIYRTTPLLS